MLDKCSIYEALVVGRGGFEPPTSTTSRPIGRTNTGVDPRGRPLLLFRATSMCIRNYDWFTVDPQQLVSTQLGKEKSKLIGALL